MAKILITGGAGFIPSSLADGLLKNKENEVILVDNLLTGYTYNLPENDRCQFYNIDVNSYAAISEIMLLHHFDYVFHYAAVVGVKRTLENPISVLKDIDGIQNILELSVKTNVKRVFYSSSSEVYGEPVSLPQHEHETPLNSKLPYAIVKNVGEAFCRSYKQEHNLDYTIFRFFNTYGPKQSLDFVMSRFYQAALKNKDITVYGEGNQTRTFCFIQDNIDTTIKCLEEGLAINDTLNLGHDKEITILELAKLIISKTNSDSKIIHLPALPEGDMTRRQPDNSKMKGILNRQLIPLEDGIEKLLEAFSIK